MIYSRPNVYDQLTDIDSFDPWLSRIQNLNFDYKRTLAADLPNEWFVEGERELFDEVLVTLDDRRRRLPDLLLALVKRKRDRFKNWRPKLSTFISLKVPGGASNPAPVV